MMGKTVGQYPLGAGVATTLTLSALPPGFYTYSIALPQGRKATGKLTIIR